MKKAVRLFCKISLFGVLFIAACKPNPKEILSRKWKPVDASGEGITEDVKRNIVKEGTMMEFTKTGDFTAYVPGEKPETGSYILNEDGKTLHIKSAIGGEVQMQIKELSVRKLVIENHGLVLIMEPAQ